MKPLFLYFAAYFSSNIKDNLVYEDLVKSLLDFIKRNHECKILIVMDSCKSNNFWEEFKKTIPLERLNDISFIGYKENWHIWKINDKYCANLGGVLHLVFHNSLAILQENSNRSLLEIFLQEGEKIMKLVNLYFYEKNFK